MWWPGKAPIVYNLSTILDQKFCPCKKLSKIWGVQKCKVCICKAEVKQKCEVCKALWQWRRCRPCKAPTLSWRAAASVGTMTPPPKIQIHNTQIQKYKYETHLMENTYSMTNIYANADTIFRVDTRDLSSWKPALKTSVSTCLMKAWKLDHVSEWQSIKGQPESHQCTPIHVNWNLNLRLDHPGGDMLKLTLGFLHSISLKYG